jgi:hypothetical protein
MAGWSQSSEQTLGLAETNPSRFDSGPTTSRDFRRPFCRRNSAWRVSSEGIVGPRRRHRGPFGKNATHRASMQPVLAECQHAALAMSKINRLNATVNEKRIVGLRPEKHATYLNGISSLAGARFAGPASSQSMQMSIGTTSAPRIPLFLERMPPAGPRRPREVVG